MLSERSLNAIKRLKSLNYNYIEFAQINLSAFSVMYAIRSLVNITLSDNYHF